jgi:hypothetical protein
MGAFGAATFAGECSLIHVDKRAAQRTTSAEKDRTSLPEREGHLTPIGYVVWTSKAKT